MPTTKHQRKIALAEQSATILKANIEVYEEAIRQQKLMRLRERRNMSGGGNGN